MKKIILSLAIVAVVATVAVTATRAYFSDTAVMSGNTFTTGTMDLKIDQNVVGGTQDWVNSFEVGSESFRASNGWTGGEYHGYTDFLAISGMRDLYPGAEKQQIMDIKNVGGVDGYATIQFDTIAWSDSSIADNLNFTVYYDADNNNFTNSQDVIAIASGNLTAWDHHTYQLGALAKNSIASVKIVWSVPTTAGNDIQGKFVDIKTTFGLNQIANQPAQ